MKVQIPILNKAAGRSGNTIFQSYYGNTYVRSMPILFHYPDTEKQQVTQAAFFDLQRIWIPIYNQLSSSIKRQQRKNKNPFNIMSSYIYKILRPFLSEKEEPYPGNFGLDRLNRVRPVVRVVDESINDNEIVLGFYNDRPYIGIDFHFDMLNLLLFNLTKQSMLFQAIPFQADYNSVSFSNTNGWEPTDEIVFYCSMSCNSWLGNFNKFDLWLK